MGENWAIAIGINHYRNLQSLNYAKRDAASVRDYFQELGRVINWLSWNKGFAIK
jgi:hypothetical protein